MFGLLVGHCRGDVCMRIRCGVLRPWVRCYVFVRNAGFCCVFAENNIGNEGAKALAAVLGENTVLATLNLAGRRFIQQSVR